MTIIKTARYAPGHMVRHKFHGYRGLIYDVDPVFSADAALYDMLALHPHSRRHPWYHVLVDGESHCTYVAEEEIERCSGFAAFDHPLLSRLFQQHDDCGYRARYLPN